jgi:hypothetical protein
MRTVVGVFVACCAVVGLSGQALAQEPSAQAGSVLPVWALVDADTPIQGGSVRVLGPNGRALTQVDGTSAPRTVAWRCSILLAFRHSSPSL